MKKHVSLQRKLKAKKKTHQFCIVGSNIWIITHSPQSEKGIVEELYTITTFLMVIEVPSWEKVEDEDGGVIMAGGE